MEKQLVSSVSHISYSTVAGDSRRKQTSSWFILFSHNPLSTRIAIHLDNGLHLHKPTKSTSIIYFKMQRFSKHLLLSVHWIPALLNGWLQSIVNTSIFLYSFSQLGCTCVNFLGICVWLCARLHQSCVYSQTSGVMHDLNDRGTKRIASPYVQLQAFTLCFVEAFFMVVINEWCFRPRAFYF